ncbi:hypothetical protein C8R47DRAFT_951641, partial [Mycena vitilis]
IGWVPGHVDFEPNERVDVEAKAAAQNDESPHPRIPSLFHSPLPRSVAAAKATFRAQITSLWTEIWSSSPRHEKYARLDKAATVNSIHKPLLNLSRRNSSLIVQLRTRMVGLNATSTPGFTKFAGPIHRYAKHANVKKMYHIPHFIFFCSRYSHHRTLLRTALGRKATSLGYLLTNEKSIRHLLRYVHAT